MSVQERDEAQKEAQKEAQNEAHGDVPHRHEQPEDWGWHAQMGRGARVAGWLVVGSLLLMLIGNHQEHTEDVWLIALAAALVGILLWDRQRRRHSWRG